MSVVLFKKRLEDFPQLPISATIHIHMEALPQSAHL